MVEGVLGWPDGRPSTIHLVRRFSQRVTACWAATVTTGVTTAQFGVLMVLREGDTLDQQTIGGRLGVDKATGTYIIDRLRRDGLVEASADPGNRRRRLITITEEGVRVLDKTMSQARRAEELIVSGLSTEEWGQLKQLLVRVLEPNQPQ
ncbi:MAG: MarR family transcriptional regulator, lower aerobic nicotinate degradation pathway regulator [Mycobacterium sp.]|jgi:DNA-binding MarR family transcriptional regulator|nr:MarR family transcriptional regulator, lower aerobic nicotinate degradation pathway regulator [Mycobacterium sp.]MDT5141307.1 MarR family transcriptional regulator, lower aerobic nicotinate degradation pathway regulator [Mycobacterium sp.]